MRNKIALGILVGIIAVTPLFASAQSADTLRERIENLLYQIAGLRDQLQKVEGTPEMCPAIARVCTSGAQPIRGPGCTQTCPEDTTRIGIDGGGRRCLPIVRQLLQGASGEDVRSLQEFLREEGHLKAEPTGFFGPMTAGAVRAFQGSEGLSQVGTVGPQTRAAFARRCGGGESRETPPGPPATSLDFSAYPATGSVPLKVNFTSRISGADFIDYGDGSSGRMMQTFPPCSSLAKCAPSWTSSHTYASNGTYTATLTEYTSGGCSPAAEAQGCLGSPASTRTVGTVTITVGGAQTSPFVPGSSCKSWYDGCNTCSRSTPGGPGACTRMGCEKYSGGYCSAEF